MVIFLDKDFVKKHFKDADIIHHLAGITMYKKTNQNLEKDRQIKIVGEEGTQNI